MRPLLKNTRGNYNKEEKQEEDNLLNNNIDNSYITPRNDPWNYCKIEAIKLY